MEKEALLVLEYLGGSHWASTVIRDLNFKVLYRIHAKWVGLQKYVSVLHISTVF